MSSQSRKPVENPPPAPGETKGAYGARIDELFREAMRDLDSLKRPVSQKAK